MPVLIIKNTIATQTSMRGSHPLNAERPRRGRACYTRPRHALRIDAETAPNPRLLRTFSTLGPSRACAAVAAPLTRQGTVTEMTQQSSFRFGLVLLVVLGIAAVVWLTQRGARYWGRRARVLRAVRARTAERDAHGLLERAGFAVLGQQVRRRWSVFADGEAVSFELIADYVVRRDGQVWVAEVKTGERALDLGYGPTRRQLLEYREAFDVAGVLLVDAEGRSIRSVTFRRHVAPPRRRSAVYAFVLGAVFGALLSAFWLGALPS
jgi:hypothetical protein